MRLASVTALIYGLIVLIGGLMGFIMSQSLPSLIAGTLFGIIILFTTYHLFKEKAIAQLFALIECAILGAFFAYRYMKSYALFPAGAMLILSALTFIILLVTYPKKHPVK